MKDIQTLHAELVAIPALSREEEPVADLLCALATSESLEFQRFGDNVVMTLGSDDSFSSPTLLLNSHLDVVPASSDHPFDPFTPTVQDGRVFGRGTVDAKASVAAMTTALISLHKEGWSPPAGRVVLALTTCEELGGSDNGLESTLPLLPTPTAAIVGEPTEMQPCVAQKGLLILKMTSAGKTSHAARAHLGINAIEMAARDLQRLSDLKFGRVHPYLGPITLTPTTIEGGTARNVVPDRCVVYLDIRSTPSYTHEELTSLVNEAVESEITVHSDRMLPAGTDPREAIVGACLAAHPGAEPFGSPTVSDWIYLRDIPTVKMGPGDSNLSHTPDESIPIKELGAAVVIYRELIKTYFELQETPKHIQ